MRHNKIILSMIFIIHLYFVFFSGIAANAQPQEKSTAVEDLFQNYFYSIQSYINSKNMNCEDLIIYFQCNSKNKSIDTIMENGKQIFTNIFSLQPEFLPLNHKNWNNIDKQLSTTNLFFRYPDPPVDKHFVLYIKFTIEDHQLHTDLQNVFLVKSKAYLFKIIAQEQKLFRDSKIISFSDTVILEKITQSLQHNLYPVKIKVGEISTVTPYNIDCESDSLNMLLEEQLKTENSVLVYCPKRNEILNMKRSYYLPIGLFKDKSVPVYVIIEK